MDWAARLVVEITTRGSRERSRVARTIKRFVIDRLRLAPHLHTGNTHRVEALGPGHIRKQRCAM